MKLTKTKQIRSPRSVVINFAADSFLSTNKRAATLLSYSTLKSIKMVQPDCDTCRDLVGVVWFSFPHKHIAFMPNNL